MGSSRADGDRVPVLAEARVLVNVVTAYERVHMSLTASLLDVDWPTTLLGIVPMRRAHLEVGLGNLKGIRLVPLVFASRLVVVALLAALPLFFDLALAWTAFIGLLAVLFLMLSVVVAIEVTHSGGRSTIPVCLLHRNRVRAFIHQVNRTAETAKSVQP